MRPCHQPFTFEPSWHDWVSIKYINMYFCQIWVSKWSSQVHIDTRCLIYGYQILYNIPKNAFFWCNNDVSYLKLISIDLGMSFHMKFIYNLLIYGNSLWARAIFNNSVDDVILVTRCSNPKTNSRRTMEPTPFVLSWP